MIYILHVSSGYQRLGLKQSSFDSFDYISLTHHYSLTFPGSPVLKISSQNSSLFLIIKVYYVPGIILSTLYSLYPVILTLTLEAFIPLTFKVIIDRYVIIAILLPVFWLFLQFFFIHLFFFFLPLWFDDFL